MGEMWLKHRLKCGVFFSEAQTKLDISMFAMLTETLAFVLPLRLVCTSVSQMSMKPSRDSWYQIQARGSSVYHLPFMSSDIEKKSCVFTHLSKSILFTAMVRWFSWLSEPHQIQLAASGFAVKSLLRFQTKVCRAVHWNTAGLHIETSFLCLGKSPGTWGGFYTSGPIPNRTTSSCSWKLEVGSLSRWKDRIFKHSMIDVKEKPVS